MSATVVKLGSSVVAQDDGELRRDVLAAICEEVSRLPEAVIVSSGAIAWGIRNLGLPTRPTAIADLQAASAVGQGKLFPVYDALLRERGKVAAQVLLTFHDMRDRTNYVNAGRTLTRLLEWGVVPVINENDTTATEEITFGDNDLLAAQIALLLKAERLVLLTNTDGLYTGNPARDPAAELVPVVTDPSTLDHAAIGHETSALGSGGMRSKVMAATMATKGGIATTICSGLRPGALGRALAGETEGTRFPPDSQPVPSFKLWLMYAQRSQGTLLVDAGAARALRDEGRSLLPVGIVDVRGSFLAGAPVDVAVDGEVIGKGLASFSADELRRVRGLRGADVRDQLRTASEEAVHRDYFVLA